MKKINSKLMVSLLVLLSFSNQLLAYELSSQDKEIIERACKIEKHLGESDYQACKSEQNLQLQNGKYKKLSQSIDNEELGELREICETQMVLGSEEYYSCIYKNSSKYQNEVGHSKKGGVDTDFSWPEWRPLSRNLEFSTSHTKKEPNQLFSELSRSVYIILAANEVDDFLSDGDVSMGSSVAINKHLLITNCHVVEGMKHILISKDELMEVGYLISANPGKDTCIVATKEPILDPVRSIKGYKDLSVGDKVYAIGSPQGLSNTLSEGIISGLRGGKEISLIQTSAAISKGSSGGGLFDRYGNLIGITTLYINDSQSLNFAVAVDEYAKD